jgi:uncharacterized protein (DUF1778 family)
VRITPDVLAIVRRATEIQGCSVSDFVAAAAQEAAKRTIEKTEIIRLSLRRNPPPGSRKPPRRIAG